LRLALSRALAAQAAEERLEWHSVAVSTLTEIEDLLDQAEVQGYREFEVTELPSNEFLVRWR
jgi:hypothetical protein